MSGLIPPLPQYAFMAWCLVKKYRVTLPLRYLYFVSLCSFLKPRITSCRVDLNIPLRTLLSNTSNSVIAVNKYILIIYTYLYYFLRFPYL